MKLNEDPDIEENTGLEFPGIQFESFMAKTFRDIDKTSNNIHFRYDLLVVETAGGDN